MRVKRIRVKFEFIFANYLTLQTTITVSLYLYNYSSTKQFFIRFFNTITAVVTTLN